MRPTVRCPGKGRWWRFPFLSAQMRKVAGTGDFYLEPGAGSTRCRTRDLLTAALCRDFGCGLNDQYWVASAFLHLDSVLLLPVVQHRPASSGHCLAHPVSAY